jgi:cell division control protein 6
MDQLATKEKNVLYSFFEWAKHPKSRLILIGIANQLDLTTKFLPRLQTKNVEPIYIRFEPYKVPEITAIITDRLIGLQDPIVDQNGKILIPVMHPMAVEMAARKLAGTGDVRKALDVCRHAIEMAQSRGMKVTVKEVLQAASEMLGSPIINRLKEVPMQSKLVLVIVVLMIQSNKELTVENMERCYRLVCKTKKIGKLDQSEFFDVVYQLEAMGFIHLQSKKKGGYTDVRAILNVNTEDVLKSVASVAVLEEILQDGSKVFQLN